MNGNKLKFEGPYGLSISKITLTPTQEQDWSYGPVTCIQVERAGRKIASVYPHPCGEFVARVWYPILTGETLEFLRNLTMPCVFARIVAECLEKYGPMNGTFNWDRQ